MGLALHPRLQGTGAIAIIERGGLGVDRHPIASPLLLAWIGAIS